jgi:hypothetical protein
MGVCILAASVAIKNKLKFGNGYCVIADVTLDNSYPTGGEAVTPGQLGLTVLSAVLPAPSGGNTYEFDHANSKLKAYTASDTEVSSGTNLSDLTVRVIAIGY